MNPILSDILYDGTREPFSSTASRLAFLSAAVCSVSECLSTLSVTSRCDESCSTHLRPISELHPFPNDCFLLGGSGRHNGRGRRGGRSNAVGRGSHRVRTRLPVDRTIPKSMGRANPPPSLNLIFKYPARIIVTNPTAAFTVRDFRINSPFSPDPTVAGSATGFPTWANIYAQQRVTNFRVRYSVTNIEPTNSLAFYWTFKDSQPSLSLTTFVKAVEGQGTSPTTPFISLGGATGNNTYRTKSTVMSPASVLGDKGSYYDDRDFTSSFTANPTQIIWASFVLIDENATTFLTTGVMLNLEFSFSVHMFSTSALYVQFRSDPEILPMKDRIARQNALLLAELSDSDDDDEVPLPIVMVSSVESIPPSDADFTNVESISRPGAPLSEEEMAALMAIIKKLK